MTIVLILICCIVSFVLGFLLRSWKKSQALTGPINYLTAIVFAVMILVFVLRPVFVGDNFMAPTYTDQSFTFIFLPHFMFSDPTPGQIVAVKGSKKHPYLIKRIIAFPGDKVEFKNGVLYINGESRKELYVRNACTWNVPPITVPKGKLFVLGDNRFMPPQKHVGGIIDERNLAGIPIW